MKVTKDEIENRLMEIFNRCQLNADIKECYQYIRSLMKDGSTIAPTMSNTQQAGETAKDEERINELHKKRFMEMMEERPVKLTMYLLSCLADRLVKANSEETTISQEQDVDGKRYEVKTVVTIRDLSVPSQAPAPAPEAVEAKASEYADENCRACNYPKYEYEMVCECNFLIAAYLAGHAEGAKASAVGEIQMSKKELAYYSEWVRENGNHYRGNRQLNGMELWDKYWQDRERFIKSKLY